MEARGYQGGDGRSKYRVLNYEMRDAIAGLSLVVGNHFIICIKNIKLRSLTCHALLLKRRKRMQRYKLTIQYDGTPYVGFQVQENGNSIQAELNKALKKMTKANTFLLVDRVV